jgi:ATP phosphoribosyltransferase regulatory subunit
VADQTFRLMDPDSQRMMGLRADTTPQVARIATTRLAQAPRPLRLSYAGSACACAAANWRRTGRSPGRDRADRADSPAADAEIVLVGAEALAAVGLTRVSFDLTCPMLVPALLDAPGSPARAGRRWPARWTARTPPPSPHRRRAGPVLTDLLLAAGPPTGRSPRWAPTCRPGALADGWRGDVARIRPRPGLR